MVTFRNPLTNREAAEHAIVGQRNTEGRNALDVMEDAGALFTVNYPPARYWDEHDATVDDYPIPRHEEGKNRDIPLCKWIVRDDNNQVLGWHGGTYPESASYRYLGELAERMFPESTTGCRLIGNGERIMLTQDIGDVIDLGGNDVLKPQILWITSMNATWSTSVLDSMFRWFCSNQIVMGDALFKCRHTENHHYTLEQRAWVLEESVRRSNNFAAMARVMKDQAYTDEQFTALTKQLVPDPRPLPGETEVKQIRWTLTNKKRRHMTEKWTAEVEHFSPTRWAAYNAVQGAEQHHILTGYKETDLAKQKALVKSVDGRTPLSTKALTLLAA
tara:strand:- start:178 stop:1170 length:993 start_codon:yes stop_codon:yes gene_type:complete